MSAPVLVVRPSRDVDAIDGYGCVRASTTVSCDVKI